MDEGQSIVLDSAQWGAVVLDRIDVEVLAALTSQPVDSCLQALEEARLADTADEWRGWSPTRPDEVRRFYSETSRYLWELLGWNGSQSYAPYLKRLGAIAARFPPESHPRLLDYGAGVGTAALYMSRLGYHVTIAEIPGLTLEYASRRLSAHGIEFEVMSVVSDVPDLPKNSWDVVISFDVLEHVYFPQEVTSALVKAVRPSGGAALVAAFDSNEPEFPHHLSDRSKDLRGHRFEMYLRALGLKPLGNDIFERRVGARRIPLLLAYVLWRNTGLRIMRIPR
jgi:SAM-dependent methyltransferase